MRVSSLIDYELGIQWLILAYLGYVYSIEKLMISSFHQEKISFLEVHQSRMDLRLDLFEVFSCYYQIGWEPSKH